MDPFSQVEPEIWHDVKLKRSASAGAATKAVTSMAPTIGRKLDFSIDPIFFLNLPHELGVLHMVIDISASESFHARKRRAHKKSARTVPVFMKLINSGG